MHRLVLASSLLGACSLFSPPENDEIQGAPFAGGIGSIAEGCSADFPQRCGADCWVAQVDCASRRDCNVDGMWDGACYHGDAPACAPDGTVSCAPSDGLALPQGPCCADLDHCALAFNERCDCGGGYLWDYDDCTSAPHEPRPTDQEKCCGPEDSCGWSGDGLCDCLLPFAWDAVDCEPRGVAVLDEAIDCCDPADPCAWSGDGFCDCSAAPFDYLDCALSSADDLALNAATCTDCDGPGPTRTLAYTVQNVGTTTVYAWRLTVGATAATVDPSCPQAPFTMLRERQDHDPACLVLDPGETCSSTLLFNTSLVGPEATVVVDVRPYPATLAGGWTSSDVDGCDNQKTLGSSSGGPYVRGDGAILLAHYGLGRRLATYDPRVAQEMTASGGGAAPVDWAPNPTDRFGHLAFTDYDPSGAEVIMECGTSGSVSYSVSSSTLFTSFAEGTYGTYGAYGSPGWGMLAVAGTNQGRSNHASCGGGTGSPSGGVGYCNGPGGASSWTNHLVSFWVGYGSVAMGCNGAGCCEGGSCEAGAVPCTTREMWIWWKPN